MRRRLTRAVILALLLPAVALALLACDDRVGPQQARPLNCNSGVLAVTGGDCI